MHTCRIQHAHRTISVRLWYLEELEECKEFTYFSSYFLVSALRLELTQQWENRNRIQNDGYYNHRSDNCIRSMHVCVFQKGHALFLDNYLLCQGTIIPSLENYDLYRNFVTFLNTQRLTSGLGTRAKSQNIQSACRWRYVKSSLWYLYFMWTYSETV